MVHYVEPVLLKR